MMRVRAAGLGAAVSVAACFAFAPMASADMPVIVKNPLPNTCLFLENTPGVAGHVPGTLRLPPPPGAPEIVFICAGPGF